VTPRSVGPTVHAVPTPFDEDLEPISAAIAARSIASFLIDACMRRLTILPPHIRAHALERPVTRRLVVSRAGYFVDDHGHLTSEPRGPSTVTLQVCVSGSAWVRLDGVHYSITPGTAFVIHSGVAHAMVSEERPLSLWWCSLVGTEVVDVLTDIGMSPDTPVIRLVNLEPVVAAIEEIVTQYEGDASPATAIEASVLGWRLMSRIDSAGSLPGRVDPVARAMDYLAERYRGHLRISELSTLVGVSPERLSAMFRAATGGGVLAYAIGLRMAEARRLLIETSESVTEISSAVGYSDPYYFSREFRRRHGVSPTGFRSAGAEDDRQWTHSATSSDR
jgi:AraC family transcriptional regulator of arabinose operon